MNQSSKNITLNSNNNIGLNNNTYTYNFIQGGLTLEDDDTLSVGSLILPNSVANVAPQYNNNQFAYIMAGLSFNGGTFGVMSFTNTGVVSNSNIVEIDITTGLPYIGYVITFEGITTSTPIYITNITYNSAFTGSPPLNATLTLNQNITINGGGRSGTGYIVGSSLLVNCNVTGAIYNIPKVNMYLPYSSFQSNNTFNLFNYITSVSVYPNTSVSSSSNLFLLTLKNPIPYSSQVLQLYTATYSKYINWVNLPSGYYNASALSRALQNTMYNNGHYYFKNTTGSINATIYYPQSIVYDNKSYGVYASNAETQPITPTNISTIYGTSASANDIIIQNGSFSDIPVPTNSVETTNSLFILNCYTFGYSASGIAEFHLGNGTNSFVSVAPPANQQYAIIGFTSQSIAPYIEQTFPINAGTYTITFIAYMKSTDPNIGIRATIDTTTVNFTPVVNTWTTYTLTPTISTSGNKALRITLTGGSEIVFVSNTLAITGITIQSTTASLKPIGTYWVNGIANDANEYCEIYMNASQNNTSYITTPDNYSLGYMTMSDKSLNAVIPTSAIYTMPYGLGMNFINGAIIRCNLVSNNLYVLTDIVDAIPFIYSFGSNNIYEKNKKASVKLRKGRYNNITFQLCDQYGNPLILLDKNVLMNFIISKGII